MGSEGLASGPLPRGVCAKGVGIMRAGPSIIYNGITEQENHNVMTYNGSSCRTFIPHSARVKEHLI